MTVSPEPDPALLRFAAVGAVLGFLAVALGAFGAHSLESFFETVSDPDKRRGWWETGVRYQAWHALLLVGTGALAGRAKRSSLLTAGVLCVAGTALFSGSLYVMTLTGIRWLGAVTPLGGLCFLGAWLAVALGVLRRDA